MSGNKPHSWVDRVRHDHPWRMRWARVRYEARAIGFWLIHPIEMRNHRRAR